MTLAPIVWTVRDRVLNAIDWSANTALGGHDQARVTAPLDEIADLTEGRTLRASLPGGAPVWEGRLLSDATPRWDGLADLDAVGHRAQADWRSGRLLYQTRDYSLWTDAGADPYNFTGYAAAVQATAEGNRLVWTVGAGEADPPGNRGMAIWLPGVYGGITRYAFDVVIAGAGITGSSTVTVKRFLGPTGARTTVATSTFGPATAASVDQAVTGAPDALLIEGDPGTLYDPTQSFTISVYNVRVNGIAVGDSVSVGDILADLAGRCGFSVEIGASAGMNGLPYDLVTGSYMDAIAYLSTLDGCKVPLVLEGDPARMLYRRYEDRTYEIRIAEGVQPTLKPNPRASHVRILYTLADGSPREVFEEIPYADLPPGYVSVATFTLSDPQPDSTLATALVGVLGPEVTRKSWTGSISGVVRARVVAGGGGEIDPRLIEPGAVVRISDWDALRERDLRVVDVAKSSDGVSLTIETPDSRADAFLAAWQLIGSQGMLSHPTRRPIYGGRFGIVRTGWTDWQAPAGLPFPPPAT